MSFAVYAALVVGLALILFVLLDMLSALLSMAVIVLVILALALHKPARDVLETRGADMELAIEDYAKTGRVQISEWRVAAEEQWAITRTRAGDWYRSLKD